MIGPRVGLVAGLRVGLAVGVSEDPITAPAPSGGLIPGVTRDAASGWYFPASAAEWTALMSFAGLATGNPSSVHPCQEAAGNLADSIGAVTLTVTGAGHLYQQPVAGFSRLAATTVDATAGQKWINTTTAPNPNTVSTGWLCCVRFPAANPAAVRDLVSNAAAMDSRITSTGKLSIINGATTNGTANPIGTVQWVYIQHDLTASTWLAYTLQEKITGTFAAMVSNPSFMVGGQTTVAGDVGYLYDALFGGVPAELSTAQVRTLLQTLTRDAVVPVVIPW